MPLLAELQKEFARALRDSDLPAPVSARSNPSSTSSRRFDVHRNNMAVGLVDALQASFPAILGLAGEEYFRAAARAYIDLHPPASPVLLLYGDRFGGFLDSLPSAGKAPYLGDVARLEWARLNALHAADTGPAGIESLAGVPEPDLKDVVFEMHPTLAVIASRWPVVSLWRAGMDPDNAGEVDMNRSERAMVTRPGLRVEVYRLPPACDVFVNELASGSVLGLAAGEAVDMDGSFDLPGCLQLVFQAGAVAAVTIP